ncbi:hypothetical protein cypCar_00041667 [Cyprinus carpio]|nr:hypothetical protein cypCar_00041667 [Cyprinus carpio]
MERQVRADRVTVVRTQGVFWFPVSSCAAMIRLAVVRSLVARHAPGPGHLHARFLGTHRRKINPEQLELPNQAREFVYSLSPANRSCLLKELQSFESKSEDSEESSPLTSAQLRYILLHNAIPFIGFGFLDNAIMIAAVSHVTSAHTAVSTRI